MTLLKYCVSSHAKEPSTGAPGFDKGSVRPSSSESAVL
ncbi:hypothetical protein BARBAKC583_1074 [Bartonella bacilliformis KC583]|uniref:Uncharacterized protein n=1 Tax=Bartonella bacilliformis (strain ATCC 35685 / KC583 / Herrer 020/F12,63) TaxID=360095 RepID=A1UTP0_BARBK|nr:hypothetical protein BARBAKC583_1074 [Bartonella bacilliformis KC583]